MLPKAILFDLDDTIISFEGVAAEAWKESCDSFVHSMNPGLESSLLLSHINRIRKWYWSDPERHRTGRMDILKARQEIVRLALKELDCDDEEGSRWLAERYTLRQEELICFFPDAVDTLRYIKASGVKMALITNGTSEKQRAKIDRFCLNELFEFCLIEEEMGWGKPDVRVYNLALEKLDLNAADVWMVGDNLVWDIEAPQKIGIFSIWNDYKQAGLPQGSRIIPDRIIHSIVELND